jgi:ribosomal protein S18 acetylase RimI-like enzyme
VITIRSTAADEAARFAHSGDVDVLADLTRAWDDGTSRPEWALVAEDDDGRTIARGALLARPMGGGVTTLEGTAAFLWADANHPRHREAFRQLIDELAACLAPHGPTTLDRRLNAEIHDDVDRQRGLLEASGFDLFQEKVGFAWTPSVSPPPRGDLRLTTLAGAGRDELRRVMAATTAGTLDRNDRYYIGRCGPEPWAVEIMTALEAGEESSWLLGYHGADPAGFVAVGAFDANTWTIVHIGVVPEHRGHGHVSELLAAADGVARKRGFRAGLSDVDVENAPMIAAMRRAGHRIDLRPWHVWHYRREVR